jgi:pumilio RNA-binding family
MMEFSLDQLGSRFIQQKLDSLTPEELEAAFAEVAPKGLMLMNDVFGNYVIQKFLELDVESHRNELAQQMKGQVRGCCCKVVLLHMHPTWDWCTACTLKRVL